MELELNASTIRLIAKKIDKRVGEVVNIIGLKAWTSLVYKTPVGNPDLWETKYKPVGYIGGRAKFSWNAKYNKPDTKIPISWGSGLPSTPTIKPSDNYETLYVTSSVPYMIRLEEGHSTQGEHMIERTISEIELELLTALR